LTTNNSWKDRLAILRTVGIYALFGSLWIFFSDTFLGRITREPDMLQRISVFKGLAFVLVTAFLLYHLINLHVRRMSAVNSRLESSMELLQAVHEKLNLADFSIRSISDAVYWTNMDGRIMDCNESACAMLGYSRDEFLSMSVLDIDPDYAKEDMPAHLEQLKRTGSIKLIRSHRAKDGSAVPVEITANYLLCEEKEYFCSIARDVTNRVSAEKETSFFRSLIERTRDPFYVLSPDDGYKMVYANLAACQHFGVGLEQLRTMSIPDWDPAFDMSSVDGLLQRMRDGKPIRFETVHRVASGRLVPVEITSSQLVHDGKEYTCGYFYDITERKAMEEALKESEARYRTLSLEFQALLEGFPDGVTLLSPDLTVLWVNAVAADLTGIEPEDIVGRHCYEVRHGFDAPCEGCIVGKTFLTGEESKKVIVFQPLRRTIELRSVPVKDENGNVVKVVEIGRDITEQVEAVAERLELERKLLHAQKLESLGILAGGIAHDFNNILTGIMGNLSILRMMMPEEHKCLERIAKCENAVSQATGLTCQLLTFSKGGDPVKKPTDLRHVIESSVSFALTGSSVAAEITIEDDLWPVEADEGQMGQVINNLLINASQAMPWGGVVRVNATNCLLNRNESATLEEGRYIRIAVSDQGEGIAPEHLAKIFDPYFTTKETGTGLGLTSVYSIVRKHGGDIFVTSEVGKGTTCHVYLPAILEEACYGNSPVSLAVSVGKGYVLVMDDEEYIRDIVCEMLSLLGYDAEGCCCGEELVQRYRDKARQGHPPDAVILDLTVPGRMGGLDAAKVILELDPAAKLIVASGYSTNPVLANYRAYGFVAALAKPFRVEDVSSELARILGK
jgi:PAS domain S-box-containing protein